MARARVLGPRITSLRSSHVFSPTDIPGIAAWYDASDAGTITASSGDVSNWADKSGNGRDLAQGTGALQPNTGSRTQNSLNVIDWALGDNMGMLLPDSPTRRFVAAVVIFDDVSGEKSIIAGQSASDNYEWRPVTTVGSGQEVLESGVAHHMLTGATELSASTWYILGFDYVSGAQAGYLNGAADGTGTDVFSFSGGGSASFVGRDYPDAVHFDGAIGELVVVDTTAVSSDDRTSLFTYLNTKWAVY